MNLWFTTYLKKQSQYAGCQPEIRYTKLEILNELKGYLKKQSQFVRFTAKGAEQAPPNAHIKGKTVNIREIT